MNKLTFKEITQCYFLNQNSSLNAFAIPGSIFLSILSGFLFPFPLALFLVCLVSKLVFIFISKFICVFCKSGCVVL